MTNSQVDNVDVVSDTGSVNSRIVISEYGQFRQFADSYLGDMGKQVVRYPVRVFTDSSAGVGSNRVGPDRNRWRVCL